MTRVPKQVRTCPTCGATFEAWPSQTRRFCSRACHSDGASRRLLNLSYPPRTCESCRADYVPNSGRQRWCSTCVPHREARARMQRYGVNEAEWQTLTSRFDGLCWICKTNPIDCVDHCHETGDVRGALCRVCNMALSYVERPDWWDVAKSYLARG